MRVKELRLVGLLLKYFSHPFHLHCSLLGYFRTGYYCIFFLSFSLPIVIHTRILPSSSFYLRCRTLTISPNRLMPISSSDTQVPQPRPTIPSIALSRKTTSGRSPASPATSKGLRTVVRGSSWIRWGIARGSFRCGRKVRVEWQEE